MFNSYTVEESVIFFKLLYKNSLNPPALIKRNQVYPLEVTLFNIDPKKGTIYENTSDANLYIY